MSSRMPPNARLWLALASMKCNSEGQTNYTPEGYSGDANDTISSGNAAVQWLMSAGLVLNDVDDDGKGCLRLAHYDDWHRDESVIGGYGPDRGLKRDGLPPMYGRSVDHVIPPQTGDTDFIAPTWAEVKARMNAPTPIEEEDPEW